MHLQRLFLSNIEVNKCSIRFYQDELATIIKIILYLLYANLILLYFIEFFLFFFFLFGGESRGWGFTLFWELFLFHGRNPLLLVFGSLYLLAILMKYIRL